MGGTFAGKDQDSTAGIYALAGMYDIVCCLINLDAYNVIYVCCGFLAVLHM